MSSFFHHELFHAYHEQFFSESKLPQFYEHLWGEGLATYISSELNPTTAMKVIFADDSIEFSSEKNIAFLLKDVQRKLISKNKLFLNTYFDKSAPKNSVIPNRAGYYVGYLVARELRQKYSLDELAHLKGKKLLRNIRYALHRLSLSRSKKLDHDKS